MGIDWGKVVTGAFGMIQDKLSGKNSSTTSTGSTDGLETSSFDILGIGSWIKHNPVLAIGAGLAVFMLFGKKIRKLF